MPKGFLIRRGRHQQPYRRKYLDSIQQQCLKHFDSFQGNKIDTRSETEARLCNEIQTGDVDDENRICVSKTKAANSICDNEETFGDLLKPNSACIRNSSAELLLASPSVQRFFPIECYAGPNTNRAAEVASIKATEMATRQRNAFEHHPHPTESSLNLIPRRNGHSNSTARVTEPLRSHGILSWADRSHYMVFASIKSHVELANTNGDLPANKDFYSYPAPIWKPSTIGRSWKKRYNCNRWKEAAETVMASLTKATTESRSQEPGAKKATDTRGTLETIENRIGEYICQLCKNQFPDAFRLADHNCSCIRHVEYRCTECNKVFNCPANLASHRRWHKPESRHSTTKDQTPQRRHLAASQSSVTKILARSVEDSVTFRPPVRLADW